VQELWKRGHGGSPVLINRLKSPDQAKVLGQPLILGVVSVDGHVHGCGMECVGDASRAQQKFFALMLLHGFTVEAVQTQQEDPVVHNTPLAEHNIASKVPNGPSSLPEGRRQFAGVSAEGLVLRVPSFYLTSEIEKKLDLCIASDMLYFLSRGFCSLAVLVSGDEDFVPVVQQFKDLGGHVALAFLKSQGRGVADELLREVDFRIDLESILVKSKDGESGPDTERTEDKLQ
jgi:uncharacterized LabA/DUF88 family protein